MSREAGHEQQSTSSETAGATRDASGDRGGAVAHTRELLARGNAGPYVYVDVILKAPSAKDEIFALLHRALGNGAVQSVISLLKSTANVVDSTADSSRHLHKRNARTDGAQATPLPGTAQHAVDTLAPRFGHSFGDVKILTGEEADARTATLGAPAMAMGKSIYLSAKVDPSSAEGTKIIAHEMAHVIQQTAPPIAQADKGTHPTRNDPAALEAEAHQVGEAVAAGDNAVPTLRTHGEVAQGYDSPEHRSTGNDVDSVLLAGTDDPLSQKSRALDDKFGGVSDKEIKEQTENEAHAGGASHSPDLGTVKDATKQSGRVAVPKLAEMLARDQQVPMLQEGSRNLTISARNYKLQTDAAGPYLALEVDPSTKQAVRYDVPVSTGDMTAINGDLYGSVENMRKAPADEIVAMRNLVEQESRWESDVAMGKANSKDEPNFDSMYEAATKWRHLPVYAAGKEIGKQGQAAGGDSRSYLDLALHNQAHFGQETQDKESIEVKVRNNKFAELARGKQGNLAGGSEEAWMNGHARARKLAKEAFDMKHAKKGSADRKRAETDDYGHETTAPETGVLNPEQVKPDAPKDARIDDRSGHVGKTAGLKRSSNVVTSESKLNDAYVENAGADHYLTDAFAAGHQISRNRIGDATDHFVTDQGGRAAFLSFVAEKIQQAAIADPAHAKGQLGEFQDASKKDGEAAIARGVTPLNTYRVVDGLKQQLQTKMTHDGLRAFGAKVVHDYYNRHGMIVRNAKGMTFVIKGDGHLGETPEARRVIALAVLESRNQITEIEATGTAANPMDVWDYTPSEDRSVFTEDSGATILARQLSDSEYLWNLLKDDFESLPPPEPPSNAHQKSANHYAEKEIDQEGRDRDFSSCDVVGEGGRCELVDAGQPPVRQWFRRRREFLQQHLTQAQADGKMASKVVPVEGYRPPTTDDGTAIKLPGA